MKDEIKVGQVWSITQLIKSVNTYEEFTIEDVLSFDTIKCKYIETGEVLMHSSGYIYDYCSLVLNNDSDYYKGDSVRDFIKLHELGFDTGSIIKYVSRAGKKPGQSKLKDMKKARDFINYIIKDLENEENK